MGQVLGIDIEKEKISEQSKKEICQAVKEQAKDYLTEEQLEEFDHIFLFCCRQIYIRCKKE